MILRELGKCRITSKKNDHVCPGWLDTLGVTCILISVGIVIYSIILGTDFLLSLLCIFAGVLMATACLVTVCGKNLGVDIELIQDGNQVKYECFAFSGNNEKDAAKIKSIVDKFEKEMCVLHEKYLLKLRDEAEAVKMKTNKEQEICNIYKSVMAKVK